MEKRFGEWLVGIVSTQAPHSRRVAEQLLTSLPTLNLNLNRIANFKLILKACWPEPSAYLQIRATLDWHGCHLCQKLPQCTS
jgi:hypothetical protein